MYHYLQIEDLSKKLNHNKTSSELIEIKSFPVPVNPISPGN